MNGLPKGFIDQKMSGWYKKVHEKLEYYCEYQSTLWRSRHCVSYEVLHLFRDGMLKMNPDNRCFAQRCYDKYPRLWYRLERNCNTESGADAPTEGYPDGSFEPSPLETPEDDKADGGRVLGFSDFNNNDVNDE